MFTAKICILDHKPLLHVLELMVYWGKVVNQSEAS